MAHVDENEQQEVYEDFNNHVNMTPKELEEWLETDESKSVGWKGEGGDDESKEAIGHRSGRRIVEIKRTHKADLTQDDYDHMQKVVNYVKRHSAQRPDHPPEELQQMDWTYSLKNWGHDPLKK